MNILVPPTTDEATSPNIVVDAKEHVIIALHKSPLHEKTSGHKIQVLADGTWKDYMSWPSDKPTVVFEGPGDGSITIRAVKAPTQQPVGIRATYEVNN